MKYTVTSVQNDGYGLRIFNLIDDDGKLAGLYMKAAEYQHLLDTFLELPGEGDALEIVGMGGVPLLVKWDGGSARLTEACRWEPANAPMSDAATDNILDILDHPKV